MKTSMFLCFGDNSLADASLALVQSSTFASRASFRGGGGGQEGAMPPPPLWEFNPSKLNTDHYTHTHNSPPPPPPQNVFQRAFAPPLGIFLNDPLARGLNLFLNVVVAINELHMTSGWVIPTLTYSPNCMHIVTWQARSQPLS